MVRMCRIPASKALEKFGLSRLRLCRLLIASHSDEPMISIGRSVFKYSQICFNFLRSSRFQPVLMSNTIPGVSPKRCDSAVARGGEKISAMFTSFRFCPSFSRSRRTAWRSAHSKTVRSRKQSSNSSSTISCNNGLRSLSFSKRYSTQNSSMAASSSSCRSLQPVSFE